MISLTDAAENKVREFVQSQSDPYTGIRLAVVEGGCSGFEYRMILESEAKKDDKVIQYQGFHVFLDQKSIPYLNGTQIDFVETPTESGFSFKNPNATGSCGCGESFHI